MWSDRRRLILGLGGSLLFNMFLLGLVLGRGLVWHRPGPPPPPPPIAGAQYVAALPDDQKAIFKAAMAARQDAIREARRRHRELRLKTEADFAAPTLDLALVKADLDALHRTNRDLEDATSAALLEALGRLTPQARATLAGRAEKPAEP